MKLTTDQLLTLGSLFAGIRKRADSTGADEPAPERDLPASLEERQDVAIDKKKKHGIRLPHAYPDYRKSLVSQYRQSPRIAGAIRAIETGVLGAILGGVLARMTSSSPKAVGAGALVGGAAMAIPGYISGSEEAKSDYTRLLALRRKGIQTPAELRGVV